MNKIVLSTAILATVALVPSTASVGYVLKNAYSVDTSVAQSILQQYFPSTADPTTGCLGPATLQKIYPNQKLVFASFPAQLSDECIGFVNRATWEEDDGSTHPVGTILPTDSTGYSNCPTTCGDSSCLCEQGMPCGGANSCQGSLVCDGAEGAKTCVAGNSGIAASAAFAVAAAILAIMF